MIFDIVALVAILTLPVLTVINLDKRRMERHIREALAVANS